MVKPKLVHDQVVFNSIEVVSEYRWSQEQVSLYYSHGNSERSIGSLVTTRPHSSLTSPCPPGSYLLNRFSKSSFVPEIF